MPNASRRKLTIKPMSTCHFFFFYSFRRKTNVEPQKCVYLIRTIFSFDVEWAHAPTENRKHRNRWWIACHGASVMGIDTDATRRRGGLSRIHICLLRVFEQRWQFVRICSIRHLTIYSLHNVESVQFKQQFFCVTFPVFRNINFASMRKIAFSTLFSSFESTNRLIFFRSWLMQEIFLYGRVSTQQLTKQNRSQARGSASTKRHTTRFWICFLIFPSLFLF